LTSSALAGAAELQRAPLSSSLEQQTYQVGTPRIQKLEIGKIFEHTCATEGYECASGYRCEFIMSRDHEDEHGNPASYSQTNPRYYSCNATGATRRPSCSLGLTPAGTFHSSIQGDLRMYPGGVPQYHCQQAL
jgi:hypothetical protein